jgi:SAM-dependent methyltransferase
LLLANKTFTRRGKMQDRMSEINERAWAYRSYEFWNKIKGTPNEVAKDMIENPAIHIRGHRKYLGDIKGKKIANLLGSNGRKAVPLALLGAEVTVVDISSENKRYAIELAKEAGVEINYILSDLTKLDYNSMKNNFDIAYLEGGILHYFADLEQLAKLIYCILDYGGRLILDDFHPVRKILKVSEDKLELYGDYFDNNLKYGDVAYKPFFPKEEQAEFPDCLMRYWTMGEIITAFAKAGFVIEQLVEEPRYDEHKHIPGNFTIIASKYKVDKYKIVWGDLV